jgi:flagellar basal-body rod protein FlgG
MPSSALQVARTGLEAQDTRMRVIANNLANVSTTAFKRDRANFATLAYQDARVAGAQSSTETAYATGLNLGTGVAVQSTTRMETQGSLQTTGNAFDLALDGDGYFQVQMPGGQLGYTRAGNFSRTAEGQLVTSQGYPLQPAITIPEGATSITVSDDGTVSAQLAGQAEPSRASSGRSPSPASPTRWRCRRRATTSCWRPPAAARRRSAWPANRAAAMCARACWKPRTSTSSRNWST